jgi:hypothetical protein
MENPVFSQQLKLVSTSANYWLIFSVPLVIAVCITQLILYQIYPLDKYVLEDAALLVTAGFCLLCFSRFIYNKDKFFLWASGMMLVLFVREVHPPGSSAGVYLGLLALFYIAYKKHYLFAAYIRSNYLVTVLGIGFFAYFLTVTTDQRFWKFIPAEKIFHTRLEESLELLGHILIGCALLFASRKASTNDQAINT